MALHSLRYWKQDLVRALLTLLSTEHLLRLPIRLHARSATHRPSRNRQRNLHRPQSHHGHYECRHRNVGLPYAGPTRELTMTGSLTPPLPCLSTFVPACTSSWQSPRLASRSSRWVNVVRRVMKRGSFVGEKSRNWNGLLTRSPHSSSQLGRYAVIESNLAMACSGLVSFYGLPLAFTCQMLLQSNMITQTESNTAPYRAWQTPRMSKIKSSRPQSKICEKGVVTHRLREPRSALISNARLSMNRNVVEREQCIEAVGTIAHPKGGASEHMTTSQKLDLCRSPHLPRCSRAIALPAATS